MSYIKLGIFDLGLITTDNYSLQTIQDSLSLVKKAEQLKYTRYWVGEHHGHDVAWASPEIILTLLAASTNSIRVGTAGVLLNYHNCLLCAQNYKLLSNIFQDRVDLGLARSLVAEEKVHKLLMDDEILEKGDFQRKALLLRSLLTEGSEFSTYIPPGTDIFPEMWMLGTSTANYQFAYENDMNFCLSLCHRTYSNSELDNLISIYQTDDSVSLKQRITPYKRSVMVNMICADNDKNANLILEKSAHSTLQVNCVGSQEKCIDYLIDLQRKFNPTEIIITDACKKIKDKKKSITLLSNAINLSV